MSAFYLNRQEREHPFLNYRWIKCEQYSPVEGAPMLFSHDEIPIANHFKTADPSIKYMAQYEAFNILSKRDFTPQEREQYKALSQFTNAGEIDLDPDVLKNVLMTKNCSRIGIAGVQARIVLPRRIV